MCLLAKNEGLSNARIDIQFPIVWLLSDNIPAALPSNAYTDIPVKVVASFKKMQSLTTDVALVLKAIRNSSLLEVSPLPGPPCSTNVQQSGFYLEVFFSEANIVAFACQTGYRLTT